ncbi:MAG: VWA domain-containing protein [Vicinamibacterales bacterium]
MRLVLTTLFATTLIGSAVAPQPQLPQPAAPDAVFRSTASLVSVNVSVLDATGRKFVTDLSRADFAIYEDGVQQRVSFFESAQVPVDLIVMLDTSSSMSDKMSVVHEAANNFLRTLRAGDRGAVVSFADQVQVIEALTSDRVKLEQAVNSTVPHGGTALNNALYVALRQFGGAAQDDGPVRRRAVALLTDGEDTSSIVSFDDVLALARKSGVNIYSISLQSAPSPATAASRKFLSPAQFSMKSLARETGGEAYFPAQVSELQGVYGTIAQELSSQYAIGYTPSNARADGLFRRIAVRVTSHPEMKPKTRAGYTADGGAPPPGAVRR